MKDALQAADELKAEMKRRHAAGETPDEIAFVMGYTRRSVGAVIWDMQPARVCTDVRCDLRADHTGPCASDEDEDEDADADEIECPHGNGTACDLC